MKRRRGLALAVVALTALTWAATVAVSRSGAGERSMAVLTALVRDPLSLLAMRSPGERGAGALLSSKPFRASRPDDAPVERVLSVVRERPPFAYGAPMSLRELEPPVMEGLPPEPDFLPTIPFGPEIEGPVIVEWPSPLWPPGLGGGGDGGKPPPQTPVPEPATWTMMILGFFAAGFMIRRAGARRVRHA